MKIDIYTYMLEFIKQCYVFKIGNIYGIGKSVIISISLFGL